MEYGQYYHHWDGYEQGLGLELVRILLTMRDESGFKGSPLFTELTKPECSLYLIQNEFRSRFTLEYQQESTDILHGDIEYLYHIDFDKDHVKLTMYKRTNWETEEHENWKKWASKKTLFDCSVTDHYNVQVNIS
jgi:hypothetical protein